MKRGEAGDQNDVKRTGRIFGWLFIGTFVTSIPARPLFIDGLDTSRSNLASSLVFFIASLELGAVLEFGLIVTKSERHSLSTRLSDGKAKPSRSATRPLASWSRSSLPSAS